MRAAVCTALSDLIEIDVHLLSAGCSERSITHQLAVHLSKHFPLHHVDCEYNRYGDLPKRLQDIVEKRTVTSNAIDAITVFPDVIVHKRGHDGENLLVIEVKKASSTESACYDLKKLNAFKSQLGYKHAVHIVVGYDRQDRLVCTQAWQ